MGAKADAQAMVMALTMSESFMFGIYEIDYDGSNSAKEVGV